MTLSSLHIMMIDDDMADTFLTSKMLHKQDPSLDIEVEHDPEKALAILLDRANQNVGKLPSLILLDINMPCMNGFEFKTELLGKPELALIPVIFLTTSSANTDVVKAYKLGGNAYITKPSTLKGVERMAASINDFWMTMAHFPRNAS